MPREALLKAGFDHTGRHEHSDNWRAPGAGPLKLRTAVQFSAEDVGIADAVAHATIVDLDGGPRLRVVTVDDVIVLKLAAAEEPKRRPSKREHDIAGRPRVAQEHAELQSPEPLGRLKSVRLRLLDSSLDVHISKDDE